MKAWHLWREDKAAVAKQLEQGRSLDGHSSAFGDNDLIVGFLMVEGLWSVLVETEADLLKKENGYPARTLNGLWALCELAGVERIAQSGKVLGEIFKSLREQFGRLGDWMKVLVMDRGYWGSAFLESIKRDEGVDYVTRAGNEELDIVSDVDGMSRLESTVWHEATEEHSRLGKMRVRMAGFRDVPMFDDKDVDHGPCQAVIAEEYDMRGQRLPDRPRFHYVTSLPVDPALAETVQAVRTYYRRRWAVENQGFWVLTKRWNLDTLVARNLNAIRARLNFALQLYNAENCCAWKHPGGCDDELPRLRRPPKGNRLGKPSIMVYTPEGQVGAFQVKEFQDLVTTATRTEVKEKIRKGLAQGRTSDEILRDL